MLKIMLGWSYFAYNVMGDVSRLNIVIKFHRLRSIVK